jgi:hypothetical protein
VQAILKRLGADLPDLALTAGTNEEFLLEFNKAAAPVAFGRQAGSGHEQADGSFAVPDLLRAANEAANFRALTREGQQPAGRGWRRQPRPG